MSSCRCSRSTIRAVADWIDGHPGESPPRAIGMHGFTLDTGNGETVSGERAIFPFDQWMFQRPLDCFQKLGEKDQGIVRKMLAMAGAEGMLDIALKHRVTRRNFALVVEQ